ncbi:MAG: glycoside hydrolase family protein [Myxococcales bacterium]
MQRSRGSAWLLGILVGLVGCGVSETDPAIGQAEDVAQPVTQAQAHPFQFGMNGLDDAKGAVRFRVAEQAAGQASSALCHVYTYWDIAERSPPGATGSHNLKDLEGWLTDVTSGKGAPSLCDEVLVTFQGSQSKEGETAPSPAAFTRAMTKLLDLTKPGQKLAAWSGNASSGWGHRARALSFTAWNEPNNKDSDGNGLGRELTPEQAAEYYLIAANLCAGGSGYSCKVAAGDFASNGSWGAYAKPGPWPCGGGATCDNAGSIERNCEDDDSGLESTSKCGAASPYNPGNQWGPSYLDRYKNYIAQHWQSYRNLRDNTGQGYRPAYWSYHGWSDINNYVHQYHPGGCSSYQDCTTRRLIESLGGTWSGAEIWDTEVAIAQPGAVETPSPDELACGAAFLTQLMDLDFRLTRIYYMWFGQGAGAVFDSRGGARPAADILASHEMNAPGFSCDATGMEPAYVNPIIPMFKLDYPTEVDSRARTDLPTEGCPDPTGLKAPDGKFYIYCTSYSLQSHRLDGFPIFESDTLFTTSNWNRVGSLIPPSTYYATWPKWIERGNGYFWGPDVHLVHVRNESRPVYVALYAAPHDYGSKVGTLQSIGMAWSLSPDGAGGWHHSEKMLISACGSGSNGGCTPPDGSAYNGTESYNNAYDPNLLVLPGPEGASDQLYLYWTVAGPNGQKGMRGQEVTLKWPEGRLEFTGGGPVRITGAHEGGYVIKHSDGNYYAFSSHGSLEYGYEVNVVRSDCPLVDAGLTSAAGTPCTPWMAAPNPVIQRSEAADGSALHEKAFVAPGGNSVIQNAVPCPNGGGVDFMVYHAILAPQGTLSAGSRPCVDPGDGARVAPTRANPYCRRQMERQAMIDPIDWTTGWPIVNGLDPRLKGRPSTGAQALAVDVQLYCGGNGGSGGGSSGGGSSGGGSSSGGGTNGCSSASDCVAGFGSCGVCIVPANLCPAETGSNFCTTDASFTLGMSCNSPSDCDPCGTGGMTCAACPSCSGNCCQFGAP